MNGALLKHPLQQHDESLRNMLLQGDVISNFSTFYGSSILVNAKAFNEYRKHVRRSNRANTNFCMDIVDSENSVLIGTIGLSSSDRGESASASLLLVLARHCCDDVGRVVIRSYIDMLRKRAEEFHILAVTVLIPSSAASDSGSVFKLEALCVDSGFAISTLNDGSKQCTMSFANVKSANSDNALETGGTICLQGQSAYASESKANSSCTSAVDISSAPQRDVEGQPIEVPATEASHLVGSSDHPLSPSKDADRNTRGKGNRGYSRPGPATSGQICPWFSRGLCRFGDYCMHTHVGSPATPPMHQQQQQMMGQWLQPAQQQPYGYPQQQHQQYDGYPMQAGLQSPPKSGGSSPTGKNLPHQVLFRDDEQSMSQSAVDADRALQAAVSLAPTAGEEYQPRRQANGAHSLERGGTGTDDAGSITAMLSSFFVGFLNSAPEYWLYRLQVRARGLSLPGYKKAPDSRHSSSYRYDQQQQQQSRSTGAAGVVTTAAVGGRGTGRGGGEDSRAGEDSSSTSGSNNHNHVAAATITAAATTSAKAIADSLAAAREAADAIMSERWTISGELVDAILRRREVKPFTVARELLPLLHRDLIDCWTSGSGYAGVSDDTLKKMLLSPNHRLMKEYYSQLQSNDPMLVVQHEAFKSDQQQQQRLRQQRQSFEGGPTLQELVQSYPQHLQQQYEMLQQQQHQHHNQMRASQQGQGLQASAAADSGRLSASSKPPPLHPVEESGNSNSNSSSRRRTTFPQGRGEAEYRHSGSRDIKYQHYSPGNLTQGPPAAAAANHQSGGTGGGGVGGVNQPSSVEETSTSTSSDPHPQRLLKHQSHQHQQQPQRFDPQQQQQIPTASSSQSQPQPTTAAAAASYDPTTMQQQVAYAMPAGYKYAYDPTSGYVFLVPCYDTTATQYPNPYSTGTTAMTMNSQELPTNNSYGSRAASVSVTMPPQLLQQQQQMPPLQQIPQNALSSGATSAAAAAIPVLKPLGSPNAPPSASASSYSSSFGQQPVVAPPGISTSCGTNDALPQSPASTANNSGTGFPRTSMPYLIADRVGQQPPQQLSQQLQQQQGYYDPYYRQLGYDPYAAGMYPAYGQGAMMYYNTGIGMQQQQPMNYQQTGSGAAAATGSYMYPPQMQYQQQYPFDQTVMQYPQQNVPYHHPTHAYSTATTGRGGTEGAAAASGKPLREQGDHYTAGMRGDRDNSYRDSSSNRDGNTQQRRQTATTRSSGTTAVYSHLQPYPSSAALNPVSGRAPVSNDVRKLDHASKEPTLLPTATASAAATAAAAAAADRRSQAKDSPRDRTTALSVADTGVDLVSDHEVVSDRDHKGAGQEEVGKASVVPPVNSGRHDNHYHDLTLSVVPLVNNDHRDLQPEAAGLSVVPSVSIENARQTLQSSGEPETEYGSASRDRTDQAVADSHDERPPPAAAEAVTVAVSAPEKYSVSMPGNDSSSVGDNNRGGRRRREDDSSDPSSVSSVGEDSISDLSCDASDTAPVTICTAPPAMVTTATTTISTGTWTSGGLLLPLVEESSCDGNKQSQLDSFPSSNDMPERYGNGGSPANDGNSSSGGLGGAGDSNKGASDSAGVGKKSAASCP